MMQRLLFTLMLLIACCAISSAQHYKISGFILDDRGEPLIGATVVEKGTPNATVTDFEGRFSLSVLDSLATLLISYTGFTSREHTLDGKKEALKIQLTPGAALEEVVTTRLMGAAKRSATRSSGAIETKGIAGAIPGPPSAPPPPGYPASAPTELRMAYSSAMDAGRADYARSVVAIDAAAGTLTAGEINDFSKWDLWQDIAAEDLMNWREYWRIYPNKRYPLQLTNREGKPVVNAVVKLFDAGGAVLWQARTDNTGKAELWDQLFSARAGSDRQVRIVVEYRGRDYPLDRPSSFQQGYNFLSIPVACDVNTQVDIAFVVDATGSMQDEIDYLKAELQDVIQRVKDTLPDADLQLGSVFYRDQGEAYLTQKTPLSSVISRTTAFISEQNAQGGGDTPEAVEEALQVALEELEWRSEAAARLLFLVLDAPPHYSPEILAKLERLTALAAARGVRIIPVACSGIDKSTEYLMRSLALATNGTYTFLTDDSGVGYSHIEPTTDSYDVEKLNALLARVIYQFAYTRDCHEPPVVVQHIPVDTGRVVAQVELPNADKPDLPTASLRFYPNPSSGPVNIEAEGIGELFLADFSGKILERFAINDTRSTIDISRYPAGTYHLRFRTDEDEWLGDQLVLSR